MRGNTARKSPTFLSLFSGCGGLDLGFVKSGFVCEGAVDIDKAASQTYAANFSQAIYRHDLSTGTLPEALEKTTDLIIAGSPCQGFSTAGKRHFQDPRNELLLVAGRIAVRLKPKVFLAENVGGVLSGTHRKYWDDLQELLKGAGYTVAILRGDANKLGVPQIRSRVFLLAWREKIDWTPVLPETPGGDLKAALRFIVGCKNHDPELLDPQSKIGIIAAHIRPRQKLCNVRSGDRAVPTWDIPEVFGLTTPHEREVLHALARLRRRERVRPIGDADPVLRSSLMRFLRREVPELNALIVKGYVKKVARRYDLTHTFNGKFRRLSWDEPSLTVDTRFGQPRYFLHPEELRGFTVREAARIQGFPDNFEFHGQSQDQYRMIGNAVPPPMAATLANAIREGLLS
jgi:DNA (cytosine-5)-methyltransferase 1